MAYRIPSGIFKEILIEQLGKNNLHREYTEPNFSSMQNYIKSEMPWYDIATSSLESL